MVSDRLLGAVETEFAITVNVEFGFGVRSLFV